MKNRFRFRFWVPDLNLMRYDGDGVFFSDYRADRLTCVEDLQGKLHEVTAVPMQCTGLKDKNGKLIYEGDIIRDAKYQEGDCEYLCRWKIVWDKSCWSCGFQAEYLDEGGGFENLKQAFGDIEVLGNVWENPELLEKAPER